MTLSAGTALGPYEIVGVLGAGGMGEVYRCMSDKTGHDEIYVRAFPGPGGESRLSAAGGQFPRWRRDGRELFYVAPDDRLMAVPIRVSRDGRTLEPDAPVTLFLTRLATGANIPRAGSMLKPQYAVAPDGRFLMNAVVDEPAASTITIVLNWDAALPRK